MGVTQRGEWVRVEGRKQALGPCSYLYMPLGERTALHEKLISEARLHVGGHEAF